MKRLHDLGTGEVKALVDEIKAKFDEPKSDDPEVAKEVESLETTWNRAQSFWSQKISQTLGWM